MPLKAIHELWAAGKMSHKAARQTLVTSRCVGADRLYNLINWTEEREDSIFVEDKAGRMKDSLESSLGSLRSHPKVLEWQQQCLPCVRELLRRFKPLLLEGRS